MPDLDGRPLYIITPREGSLFTPGLMCSDLGLYVDGLDAMLRAELEADGRWRGPGPAVVVDPTGVSDETCDRFDAERRFVGVVLHELAHWIDRPESATLPPQVAAERFSRVVVARGKPRVPTPIPATFWVHGVSFTRICCHIWHRMQTRGGFPIRPKWLGFGGDYPGLESLASPGEFIGALGEEMERLTDLPLRDLKAIEPPAEFVETWRASSNRLWADAAARHTALQAA